MSKRWQWALAWRLCFRPTAKVVLDALATCKAADKLSYNMGRVVVAFHSAEPPIIYAWAHHSGKLLQRFYALSSTHQNQSSGASACCLQAAAQMHL